MLLATTAEWFYHYYQSRGGQGRNKEREKIFTRMTSGQAECGDPQLVSSMLPSGCKEAMPKSAILMLFLSSSSRFSGLRSRWLKEGRKRE